MSDNWIVANLENAFETWNDKMAEIWTLVTTSPETFKGGTIWTVVQGINGGLQAIGLGLLVLFFAMSIFKSTASFRDFQRPEYALRHFIRFVAAKVAITYAMDLMVALYTICGGVVEEIAGSMGGIGAASVTLPAAIETAVEDAKASIRAICDKLPLKDLDLSNWGADAAQKNFDSPIWEQLYHPCLACGTCTFVCPTCQCYDIKDYNTGSGVQRYRCWDSCMYSDFTMMAHGNNRNSQMQRFRQRFMHKLAYFPANNQGMFSCVGCGRCVEKCPSHLNIVKVIKAFGKEDA